MADIDKGLPNTRTKIDIPSEEEIAEEVTVQEPEELRSQGEAFAFDPFQAAGGGIAKLAGDRSGAMLTSMNPDKDGLQGLLNRVKKQ